MQFEHKTVKESLNQAFRRDKIERDDFNNAAGAMQVLANEIRQAKEADETEEHYKTFLDRFLNKGGFSEYYINTDGYTDWVIHNGSKKSDSVGVMIETKKPGSRQMITPDNLNRKALREAILYYLQERLEKDNTDVKHIIISDFDDWFIFDAQEFDRHFVRSGPLKKEFENWGTDQKTSSNKPLMYDIIKEYLDENDNALKGTRFSLDEFYELLAKENRAEEEERKLIPLIKLLSPVHLLKKPFSNDSNSLNKPFYNELLYIIGLEEKKDGSTKLIGRPDKDNRVTGSLIENTINTLRKPAAAYQRTGSYVR